MEADINTLYLIAILASPFYILYILGLFVKYLYRKYRKYRYGNPKSSCQYCRDGVSFMGKAHVIDDGYGLGLHICTDKINETLRRNHGDF